MEENGVVIQAMEMGVDEGATEMAAARNGRKRQRKEPSTPTLDRPSRERRSIDRFVASAEKEVKEFKIEKGSGTTLKDIPNVVYKLSKRKGSDEVVQLLHRILFAKPAKSHVAKGNILQFSGYAWCANEEKQKAKVKEKLEKCVKENLIQMSELLDMNISKSSKKEDAVVKLLDFLESPHQTTDKLIEEKVKDSKMKKIKKKLAKEKKKASRKAPQKRQKKESKEESDNNSSDEEVDADSSTDNKDNIEADVESEDNSEDDDYDIESKGSKKRRNSAKSSTRKLKHPNDDEGTVKVASNKRDATLKANHGKVPNVVTEEVTEPSDEELQVAIRELLKNADFTKVTFADILKQLGKKFGLEVFSNKAHVKALIQAEIAMLAEGSDEDSENENNGNMEKENDGECEDGRIIQEVNEGEAGNDDGESESDQIEEDNKGENGDGDIENNGSKDNALVSNEKDTDDDGGGDDVMDDIKCNENGDTEA